MRIGQDGWPGTRPGTRAMNIILAHSHLDTFGGGERSVLELAQRLGTNNAVEIWTGNYQADQTFAEFAHMPLRTVSARDWLTKTPDADVIVAHSFGAYLLALRHPRTVCYIHTLRSAYLQPSVRPAILARRYLDSMALRRAARVVTNSTFAAQQIHARYDRDALSVPPGVRDSLFSSPPTAGTYALYLGRLAPEKGIERLLRWHAQVDLDLHVVGTGPASYVMELRRHATPNVHFMGAMQNNALDNELASCRFLAFLPEREEFGLAALEAMAAAKPVIALQSGALPELIKHGESGYLVSDAESYAKAATKLIESDDLCLRMGQRDREFARGYSWQRYADAIEAICEEVCSARR